MIGNMKMNVKSIYTFNLFSWKWFYRFRIFTEQRIKKKINILGIRFGFILKLKSSTCLWIWRNWLFVHLFKWFLSLIFNVICKFRSLIFIHKNRNIKSGLGWCIVYYTLCHAIKYLTLLLLCNRHKCHLFIELSSI